jgi:hypothetical protein
MATFSKVLHSGSTGGKPVKVVATATAGTTIHTTGTSASVIDEVWIYATNTSASAVLLTLEWGGVTSPDDKIVASIPPQSTVVVVPGQPLSGTGSAGRTVGAFAGTTAVINVFGYVNRIS